MSWLKRLLTAHDVAVDADSNAVRVQQDVPSELSVIRVELTATATAITVTPTECKAVIARAPSAAHDDGANAASYFVGPEANVSRDGEVVTNANYEGAIVEIDDASKVFGKGSVGDVALLTIVGRR